MKGSTSNSNQLVTIRRNIDNVELTCILGSPEMIAFSGNQRIFLVEYVDQWGNYRRESTSSRQPEIPYQGTILQP